MSLLRLGDADHAVLLTMHHLITDGWSFGVAAQRAGDRFTRPIARAARRRCRTRRSSTPISPAGSAASSKAEPGRRRSRSWRRRLAGVPALELPTDRPRPPIRTARGALHPLVLSPELSAAVRAVARREGVTPFMTLLAAFQLVLGRWSGQDDFAVGVPVANRSQAETERLIGYFVNMIALRADLSGNPTVREFLARVREVALEAFENQDGPARGPHRRASAPGAMPAALRSSR